MRCIKCTARPVIWPEVLSNWDSFRGVFQFSAQIRSNPPISPSPSIREKRTSIVQLFQQVQVTHTHTHIYIYTHKHTHTHTHAHTHTLPTLETKLSSPISSYFRRGMSAPKEKDSMKVVSIFQHSWHQFASAFDMPGSCPPSASLEPNKEREKTHSIRCHPH